MSNEVEDPRLGLPSASSFSLDALCPGRQALLNWLRVTQTDTPEPKDEDAERGTCLHAAWEKSDPSALDTADTEIYQQGEQLCEQVVSDWKAHSPALPKAVEGTREQRFYFHDEHGNVAASGQADRHWTAGREGLVIDFKSLWCRSLTPAELNWQARLLSVLMFREYDCTRVRFAFLKAMFRKADIVDYLEVDLKRAEWSVQQVLWETRLQDAQRRSGAHCRRCKGAAMCPEAAAWVSLPSALVKARSSVAVTPKQAQELANEISLRDCKAIWAGITARHNIENAVKARLKALPEPELADLGLRLGTASINRPITLPAAAFSFLQRAGIPEAKIWTAITMKNGELDAVVQECLGLRSKKAAETWIREKLANCITERPQEKPLEHL